MTWHLHHLWGCAPTPLAHYLKALGILRIVSATDVSARGWWEDEHFCLLSRLSEVDLERYFLAEYSPTALVSPWNRGSGFYGKSDPAVTAIECSLAPRFQAFREGAAAARTHLTAISQADAEVRRLKNLTKAKRGMSAVEQRKAQALKDDPAFKAELAAAERRFKAMKADLFTTLMLTWRGGHRDWLDSAAVVLDDSRVAWPSLFGTGGADGRLEFTNNLMQRLGELFDLASPTGVSRPKALPALRQAIWARPANVLSPGAAVGQFLPGGAGGANSSTGPEGDSLVNPWDFVLMLEGAVLFRARATKRLDPVSMARASAPFAVRPHGAGLSSRGQEKAERGEQWMPLWSAPTSVAGIESLLGEGRVQLGRQLANRPVDVARALSRLGTARGVSSFVRFGYLERNGQSTMAAPLGRVEVTLRPQARLIDDLAPWLDRLQREARDKNAPARLRQAEGRLADAVFAALTHDDRADRWQAVLLAAVEIEGLQSTGAAINAGPIPPLDAAWLEATNDGSVEWRLARAVGSAAAGYGSGGRPWDPVRHHWLPLESGSRRFKKTERRLRNDPRVVIRGRSLVADLVALVERRIIEGAQRGERRLPLQAADGCDASLADIGVFIAGTVDEGRLLSLARAFMAVRWERHRGDASRPPRGRLPDDAWLAVRLSCLPWSLSSDRAIPVDASIVKRLCAGEVALAVETALRRIRAAGIRPPLRGAFADPVQARRWAAALAFPISLASARDVAAKLAPISQKETR